MKLALAEIVVDESIYPRNQTDWLTTYRYQEAMRAGAAFPPLVVGRKARQYILLDGRHRLLALLKNRQLRTAVIVSKVKPSEFFLEAVRLNAHHGRTLTTQERIAAAARLTSEGFGEAQVSEALFMPVETLRRLMVERVVRRPTVQAPTPLVRKAAVAAGNGELHTAAEQKSLAVRAAPDALRQVIQILENRWYSPDDPETRVLLARLSELLLAAAVA
jgi:hypothetical protein